MTGVVTHPTSASAGHSYIPASYVKFLEAGGARVAPILYDLPDEELTALLASLNGALFIGYVKSACPASLFYASNTCSGNAAFFEKDGETLTTYAKTGRRVYETAVIRHSEDESWPLWGTCLGQCAAWLPLQQALTPAVAS